MNSTQPTKGTHNYMRTVILITTVTALGGFLFGFDNGAISGSVGDLTVKFDLSPAGIGWVTSSLIVGCIIGVIVSGKLSDAIGRRKVLLLVAAIFAVGALGEALAPSASLLVCARMLVGFGIGTETVVAPLYIAEVAPAERRGRLVSFNQLFNTIGNLVIFSVAAIIISVGSAQWNIDYGWRWIFASGLIPTIIFIVLLRFIPESPRWLLQKGRTEEGMKVLRSITSDETAAQSEYKEIIESLAKQKESSSLKTLLQPGLRKALVVGFGCALFQQITGINAIFYYAPEIFKNAGLSADSAMLSTVIVGGGLVIGTLLSMWLIDKIGRRTLLIFGAAGMTMFHALIGWVFSAADPNGGLLLFLVVCYVLTFAMSFGAVAYVVISEIFPTHVRGMAASVATFALWGGNFLVSQFFPVLVASIGSSTTFFIFSGVSAVALIFVLTCVPETKGKTLEEIEQQMGTSLPAST